MVKTKLLLFDEEIGRLANIGWEYIVIYAKNEVYLVEVDVPEDVLKKVAVRK